MVNVLYNIKFNFIPVGYICLFTTTLSFNKFLKSFFVEDKCYLRVDF